MNKQYFRIQHDAKLNAAIERAKAGKLFVKPAGEFRSYTVVNRENGNAYTVEFLKTASGTRLGRCSCPSKVLCKHISAAVGLHLYVAANRQSH